jgi:hypothetical protein
MIKRDHELEEESTVPPIALDAAIKTEEILEPSMRLCEHGRIGSIGQQRNEARPPTLVIPNRLEYQGYPLGCDTQLPPTSAPVTPEFTGPAPVPLDFFRHQRNTSSSSYNGIAIPISPSACYGDYSAPAVKCEYNVPADYHFANATGSATAYWDPQYSPLFPPTTVSAAQKCSANWGTPQQLKLPESYSRFYVDL